jgi:hypothetical protein
MISGIFSKLLIFCYILTVGLISFSFSATLSVTKIGNLDLAGKMYTEWWYTASNPTFYGKASPNSEVSIIIGAETFKTMSSSDGSWSYGTSLASGDYDISFAQGQEKITFKLHLGQPLPDNLGSSGTQASQSTTPSTGFDQLVFISLGAGVLLLATYFYIRGDPRRKSVFEARILKED